MISELSCHIRLNFLAKHELICKFLNSRACKSLKIISSYSPILACIAIVETKQNSFKKIFKKLT